jgi:CRISPR type IV-associated protein Csf2
MHARKIRLTGEIVALSPLCITAPPPESGPKRESMGIPTLTVRSESGGVSQVATIPGYNFKGVLRHQAADVVRDALAAAGMPAMDLATYYLTAIGGIKNVEKEDARNILRMKALRAANPVLALFGASVPHFMQGCLSVSFATVEAGEFNFYDEQGMRTDAVRRRPTLLDELDGDAAKDYADYVKSRSEAKEENTKIKALGKKIVEARKANNISEKAVLEAEHAAEKKKSEDAKGDRDAQIMRPLTRRGVAPGARFSQTMTLTSPSHAELGLFLAALKRFAGNCRLGGLEAVGFGQISASWTIEEVDLKTLAHTRLGSIRIADCEYDADLAHPTLAAAVAAWEILAANPSHMALTAEALRKISAA